ncbi:MAG: hypothetical protein IJ656_03055 [Bacilli bacterium]|nr:hypothetical protein [Bacilli bacterium]MBR1581990.1 hypothetical protein [Bacilli bacterium]
MKKIKHLINLFFVLTLCGCQKHDFVFDLDPKFGILENDKTVLFNINLVKFEIKSYLIDRNAKVINFDCLNNFSIGYFDKVVEEKNNRVNCYLIYENSLINFDNRKHFTSNEKEVLDYFLNLDYFYVSEYLGFFGYNYFKFLDDTRIFPFKDNKLTYFSVDDLIQYDDLSKREISEKFDEYLYDGMPEQEFLDAFTKYITDEYR